MNTIVMTAPVGEVREEDNGLVLKQFAKQLLTEINNV
jgi:hypothetical protein